MLGHQLHFLTFMNSFSTINMIMMKEIFLCRLRLQKVYIITSFLIFLFQGYQFRIRM